MLRRLLAATAALVAVLALSAPAALADAPCPVLSATGPLPVEFSDGSVSFRQAVFGRPGVTVASTGVSVAKALRDAGAATGYWEMNLPNLVGTPSAPADPAGMDAVAAAEVQKAQASTACPNPVIALNELLGSDIAGPLPANAQRYRDAVLALMRALAADGATPFLLVPRRFTVSGTEDWWRQVGQVGWLVPEAYTPATSLAAVGNPFLISRAIRVGFRDWIAQADRARHPRVARRPDARVPVGRSVRRARRPAAGVGLAPDREAPVAGGPGGRARARALERVVVGVGDVRDAGQRRPRQAGGRLHLSVGARSDALRCPGAGRPRLRSRPDGRLGGPRRCVPVPLERRLVPHGRGDRADECGRLARGRADDAARAHARAQAHDGRPDRRAARPAQRDRRAVRRRPRGLQAVPAGRGRDARRRARRHPRSAAGGQDRTRPAGGADHERRCEGVHRVPRRHADAQRRDRPPGALARRAEPRRGAARARAAGRAHGIRRLDRARARRRRPGARARAELARAPGRRNPPPGSRCAGCCSRRGARRP